jgi:hypothetical protein
VEIVERATADGVWVDYKMEGPALRRGTSEDDMGCASRRLRLRMWHLQGLESRARLLSGPRRWGCFEGRRCPIRPASRRSSEAAWGLLRADSA